ncbi:STAS domain-containing protein [Lentzea tibetensis]|uniref:Anti-sigma factor antagonist n=2 Tax=Lentzea tibetensis TaxID=2591470 RepID=A0A563EHI6_9PSEU|nr:STAS domain-containing protein [Lentzea tibetensis]
MGLWVGSEVFNGWRVVAVVGELDFDTVPMLATRLEEDVTGGWAVLDLGGVTFMTSAGLALLLEWHRRLAEKGGALRIAAPQAQVLRLFALADVVHVLDVRGTTQEACG